MAFTPGAASAPCRVEGQSAGSSTRPLSPHRHGQPSGQGDDDCFEAEAGRFPASAIDSPRRLFDTALGRIGITICYDSEFPLIARALVQAGAQ
jgi:hypothetical protein